MGKIFGISLLLFLLAADVRCDIRTVHWDDTHAGFFFANQSAIIKTMSLTSPVGCGAQCLAMNACRSFCMIGGAECYLSSMDRWIDPDSLIPMLGSVYFGLGEHSFPFCEHNGTTYDMLTEDEKCDMWKKRFDCQNQYIWGEWSDWTPVNSNRISNRIATVRTLKDTERGPFHGGKTCKKKEQFAFPLFTRQTRDEAARACAAAETGALLATYHSEYEMRKLNVWNLHSFWTGWRKSGGVWIDSIGNRLSSRSTLWKPQQPSGDGLCVNMLSNGLNDLSCAYRYYAICITQVQIVQ